MNGELKKKLYRIGKMLLTELYLHNRDVVVARKKSKLLSGDDVIFLNLHPTITLTKSEITYLREDD